MFWPVQQSKKKKNFEKNSKDLNGRKKSLFADNMIVFIENPKEPIDELLEFKINN